MSQKADFTGCFLWSPRAQLFDALGEVVRRATGGGVISGASGPAIASALAQAGTPFRIGGQGALEAGLGQFETLTSGSSGQPRRILRSMASWLASFAVNADLFAIGPGARVAVLGQMTHSLALYGVLEGLHLGAEVHLLDSLRPDRQRAALAARGVTHLYATPAQLRLLVEAGGETLAISLILVGGSKLDKGLRAGVAAMAPMASLREFYGAAEASFITLAAPDSPEASVGVPYPGVQIALRDTEIWVQSPYLFEAYAGEPSPGVKWQDGWLSVGEMGRLEGGFLYLSGRAGRMVTVADQNVFPEEIEAFLLGLPGITRAAVLPHADAKRGHHLVAFVQGDPACEPEILKACRASLGPLKSPKSLIWRVEWPSLAAGKTDLQRLAKVLE